MFLARILLLALVGLGLQVPSGIAFHWCLCGAMDRDEHVAAQVSEDVDQPDCCSQSEVPASSPKKAPCGCAEKCGGCLELSAPDHGPTTKVVPASSVDIVLQPAATFELPEPALVGSTRAGPFDREHEPPWARRNRQLLL